MKKLNVLWLSAAPHLGTGFATVARNILDQLNATGLYDFTIIGINHYGDWYDQKKFPYRMFPAHAGNESNSDLFGRVKFIDFISKPFWDLVFTLYDPFILAENMPQIGMPFGQAIKTIQRQTPRPFKWIGYFPVDAPQEKQWIQDSAALCDVPIFYTNWGKDQALKVVPELSDKAKVIYHGVNTSEFYPVGKQTVEDFRRKYFKGRAEGKFLVVNVNRNQQRKDWLHTLITFKELKKQIPEATLYCHTKPRDMGGDLPNMMEQLGIDKGDVQFPGNFNEYWGVPQPLINMIYNAADVVISTTHAEGFGLSSIEAMATKTPVVMPDNSSLSEILGDGRGRLVPCGKNPGDFAYYGKEEKFRISPVVSVEDMVKEIVWVRNNPEDVQKMVEKAYNWVVKELDWDKIGQQFQDAFWEGFGQMEADRLAKAFPKLGRNDMCPLCNIKYKKCKHGRANKV